MRQDDIIPPESGGDEPAEEARRIPPIIDQDDRSFMMRHLGPLIENVQTALSQFWQRLLFWLKRVLLITAALAALVMVGAQFISPDRSGNILHWQNLTQRFIGFWADELPPAGDAAPADQPQEKAALATAREVLLEDQTDRQQTSETTETSETAATAPPVQMDTAPTPAPLSETAQAELMRERAAHATTRAALLALQTASAAPVQMDAASQQDLVAALIVQIESGQAYGGALGAIDDIGVMDLQSRALLAAHAQGAPNMASLQRDYAILRAILTATSEAIPDSELGSEMGSGPDSAPPPAAFTWLKQTSRGLVDIKKAPAAAPPKADAPAELVARLDAMMAQGALSELHATLIARGADAPAASTVAWQKLSHQMGVYLQLQPIIAALKQNYLLEAAR